MINFTNYIKKMLSITIALVVLTSGFNIIIDPHRLFDTPLIKGINAYRPEAINAAARSKKYNVLRRKPHTVIIGNSRPEMGLSPENICWPNSKKPVFNSAFSGATLSSQIIALQNAYKNKNVRYVLMALDYTDFVHLDTSSNAKYIFQDIEKRYSDSAITTSPDFSTEYMADFLESAISFDTFLASVQTVIRQGQEDTSSIAINGFHNASLLYRQLIADEGHQAILTQKTIAIDQSFRNLIKRTERAEDISDVSYKLISSLIKHNKNQDIRTVFFINPYHVQYLSLMKKAGMWQAFNKWKKRLAALAKIEKVDLWDFSDIGIYSIQPIGKTNKMAHAVDWFWEPSHYSKELGDIVLETIHHGSCPKNNRIQQDSWGKLISALSPSKLNEYLIKQTNALIAYENDRKR
ncbi:hypothetical protein [Kordiimonas aquimaris]|uniref:hypothetical protein n=1 Tax=Kordiimonas aquimaris TaxID=707591 RepID=UPI0021D14C77|nr:hypothetical protein [Kordiimonas aquimaris]